MAARTKETGRRRRRRRTRFRRRYRAPVSEMLGTLVDALNAGVVLGGLFYILSGAITPISALAIAGTYLVVQGIERLWPGILFPRRVVTEVGADGLTFQGRFVPWHEVSKFEHEKERAGWRTQHFFKVTLVDGETIRLHASQVKALISEAHERVAAYNEPMPEGDEKAYRAASGPDGRFFVRVALDPAEDKDRRLEAFARLEEPERHEVIESMADESLRDELEAAVGDAE